MKFILPLREPLSSPPIGKPGDRPDVFRFSPSLLPVTRLNRVTYTLKQCAAGKPAENRKTSGLSPGFTSRHHSPAFPRAEPLTCGAFHPYTRISLNRMSKTKSDSDSLPADRDLYSGLIRLHGLHHAAGEPIFRLGIIQERAPDG